MALRILRRAREARGLQALSRPRTSVSDLHHLVPRLCRLVAACGAQGARASTQGSVKLVRHSKRAAGAELRDCVEALLVIAGMEVDERHVAHDRGAITRRQVPALREGQSHEGRGLLVKGAPVQDQDGVSYGLQAARDRLCGFQICGRHGWIEPLFSLERSPGAAGTRPSAFRAAKSPIELAPLHILRQ